MDISAHALLGGGEWCFDLSASPLLPLHDRVASIEADDVERIVANIDAHRGNGRD